MGRLAQAAGVSETRPPAGRISRKGPIDQVRRLKRSVMVWVYGAILGFIPFYAFVLHYTPEQLVIGTVIGLGIAVSAIELAFGQMFRFRKRSSYPGTLLVEAGAASSMSEATALVLEVVMDVLDLAGAAIALPDADGRLSLIATNGLNDEQAAELREVYHDEICAGNPKPADSASVSTPPRPWSRHYRGGADRRLGAHRRRACDG